MKNPIIEQHYLIQVSSALLINFANSLDPGQVLQNIGPDLDPNSGTLMVILIFFFFFLKKLILKKSADNKKSCRQELIGAF